MKVNLEKFMKNLKRKKCKNHLKNSWEKLIVDLHKSLGTAYGSTFMQGSSGLETRSISLNVPQG